MASRISTEDVPFRIENRVIPARVVQRFRRFMRRVRDSQIGEEISFAFPSNGNYHDLVRGFWEEFSDACSENHTVNTLGLPTIERHGRSDFDHSQLWRDIGGAINRMKVLNKVYFYRGVESDLDAICNVVSSLTRVQELHFTDGNSELDSGRDISALGQGLRNLHGLKELRINGFSNVSEESLDAFVMALESLKSLERLTLFGDVIHLSREKYQSHELLRLSTSFSQSQFPFQLKEIEIGPCHLASSLSNYLAAGLKSSDNLSKVDLHVSCLSDLSFIKIGLGQNQSCQSARLEFSTQPKGVFDFLSCNKTLQTLELSGELDFDSLGLALAKNTGLRKLEINFFSSFCNYVQEMRPEFLVELFRHSGLNRSLKTLAIVADFSNLSAGSTRPSHYLKDNYSITSIAVDTDRNEPDWVRELQIIADLNAIGRGYMASDATNRSMAAEVLSRSQTLDCVFFHLRENPLICSMPVP